MAIKVKILNMGGMSQARLLEYFYSIGGKNLGDGKFVGQDWEIEVQKEKIVSLGSLNIPSTIVIFRCEDAIIDNMLKDFRQKFLTAGG